MLYLGLSIPYEGQQMVYQGLLGTEYAISVADQAILEAGDGIPGAEQPI